MGRRISIFGVTGSIGASAVALLRENPGAYDIDTLSANENCEMLLALAHEFRPAMIVTGEAGHYDRLRAEAPSGVAVAAGRAALLDAAARPVDWLLNAVIGAAGLEISLRAAGAVSVLALANKESLVSGGALLPRACAAHGTSLVPVDSEHSAIFQALIGQDRSALDRITLTASGGPFRNHSRAEMAQVRLEDALKHPNWDMGARITIDSASMFNKALEMIEAKYLFDLAPAQVRVVIHPQSIVHSLVGFNDGGELAQLGLPDMRHPLAFALGYPRRMAAAIGRLDLASIGRLDFFAPDENRFPALRLARAAMDAGGVMGAVLNAAKEIALDRFIAGEIGFLDMAVIVEAVIEKADWALDYRASNPDLEMVLAADGHARELAAQTTKRY